MPMPSPQHARTFVLGALACVVVSVSGTAVFSHDAPQGLRRTDAATTSTPGATGQDAQTAGLTAPSTATSGAERGQAVSAALRTKALRTATLTDIPPTALAAYQRAATSMGAAAPGCHLSWTLLAAVGQVESDHGRTSSRNARGIVGVPLDGKGVKAVADTDGGALDGDKLHDRAVGPMQILPSTWASVAVDADGDGRRDPQDIDDAALGAAVYLCGSGGDLSTASGQSEALRTYNDSASYVSLVMAVARAYAEDEKASYAVNGLRLGDVDLTGSSTTVTTTPAVKAAAAKHSTTKASTKAATKATTAKTTRTVKTPTAASSTPVTTPAPTGTGTPQPTPTGPGTPTGPTPTPTPTPSPTPAPKPAPKPDATVPALLPDLDDMVQALRDAGKVGHVQFFFTTVEAYSDTVPAGEVISTDPVAATEVTSPTKLVTITVSLGVDPDGATASSPSASPSAAS